MKCLAISIEMSMVILHLQRRDKKEKKEKKLKRKREERKNKDNRPAEIFRKNGNKSKRKQKAEKHYE